MSAQTINVTIPSVTLTLDQLLTVVKQLNEPARVQVALALLETEMDSKLSALIRRLVEKQPVDVSDDAINAEVRAVRQSRVNPLHA